MKYDLIRSTNLDNFRAIINSRLNEGYKLSGELIYLPPVPPVDTVTYVQAMVLEEDVDELLKTNKALMDANRALMTENRELIDYLSKAKSDLTTVRRAYENYKREQLGVIAELKSRIPTTDVDSQDMRELNDNYPHGE